MGSLFIETSRNTGNDKNRVKGVYDGIFQNLSGGTRIFPEFIVFHATVGRYCPETWHGGYQLCSVHADNNHTLDSDSPASGCWGKKRLV